MEKFTNANLKDLMPTHPMQSKAMKFDNGVATVLRKEKLDRCGNPIYRIEVEFNNGKKVIEKEWTGNPISRINSIIEGRD